MNHIKIIDSPHLFAQLEAVGHFAVLHPTGACVNVQQIRDARTQPAPTVALHCADAIVL